MSCDFCVLLWIENEDQDGEMKEYSGDGECRRENDDGWYSVCRPS